MSEATARRGFLTALADGCDHAGYTVVLVTSALARGILPRQPARTAGRLVEQLHVQMVKSLLVVSVVGLFMGMILSLQTGEELQRYGAEGQLPNIVAATLAREMGPFITAIILAATVGAAIAAELGTMRVSEEIDALELMNIDPVTFLVFPRVLVLGVTAILLTVYVDFIGIAGAAFIASAQYGTTVPDFFEGARSAMEGSWFVGGLSKDLYTGLVKAAVFGVMIGGLACAAGLRARGGALGVGRAVRSSVVASVVITLVVGYILTSFFWA